MTLTIFLSISILGRSWWFWLIIGLIIYYASQKKKVPAKDRMPADLQDLKRQAARFEAALIPWGKSEIELLSLNKAYEKVNKKKEYEVTGAFVSIYQEPLFGYGYKLYTDDEGHGVLYACTKGNEFFFRIFPKEADVQINGNVLGKIMDGKLFGTDGRMLANFLNNRLEGYTSIIISNKDAGHILNRDSFNNDVNPRALDLVDTNLDADELRIFLAMTIWKVVRDNVQ
jgi:hypothetical protein